MRLHFEFREHPDVVSEFQRLIQHILRKMRVKMSHTPEQVEYSSEVLTLHSLNPTRDNEFFVVLLSVRLI